MHTFCEIRLNRSKLTAISSDWRLVSFYFNASPIFVRSEYKHSDFVNKIRFNTRHNINFCLRFILRRSEYVIFDGNLFRILYDWNSIWQRDKNMFISMLFQANAISFFSPVPCAEWHFTYFTCMLKKVISFDAFECIWRYSHARIWQSVSLTDVVVVVVVGWMNDRQEKKKLKDKNSTA